MQHETDRIQAIARGDGDALRDLADYVRRILARGFSRQLSEADLSDLTQEAVLRIHQNIDGFTGKSRLNTWAASIAVNTALMEVRRRRHAHVSLTDAAETARELMAAPAAPDAIAKAQVSRLLLQAIDDALTPLQRTALLADLAGMPVSEIARKLQRKRGAIYKLLHDARKRLLAHFQQQGLSVEALLRPMEAVQ
ncbi:MAG: RNA polymerase sigma-70 factor (ECF subfamily) [Myxococcota bacterium]